MRRRCAQTYTRTNFLFIIIIKVIDVVVTEIIHKHDICTHCKGRNYLLYSIVLVVAVVVRIAIGIRLRLVAANSFNLVNTFALIQPHAKYCVHFSFVDKYEQKHGYTHSTTHSQSSTTLCTAIAFVKLNLTGIQK